MKTGIAALALAATVITGALPAAAHGGLARYKGFSTPATITGKWVLSPRACPDLLEDRRDRRVDEGKADRREDRRDRRVLDCPAEAWTFVPDAGQSPGPIRLPRGWHKGHHHGHGNGYSYNYGHQAPAYNPPVVTVPSYTPPVYNPPYYQGAGHSTTTQCYTIGRYGQKIPTACR